MGDLCEGEKEQGSCKLNKEGTERGLQERLGKTPIEVPDPTTVLTDLTKELAKDVDATNCLQPGPDWLECEFNKAVEKRIKDLKAQGKSPEAIHEIFQDKCGFKKLVKTEEVQGMVPGKPRIAMVIED